jgi:hypothetical protein
VDPDARHIPSVVGADPMMAARMAWGGGWVEEREASIAERMEGSAAGAEASWGGSDDGGVDGVGRISEETVAEPCTIGCGRLH